MLRVMSGPSSATASTQFLVISDTHNFESENDTASALPFHLHVPKVDILLTAVASYCGGSSSYKKGIKTLDAVDAELKLVVAGNHDLNLDKRY